MRSLSEETKAYRLINTHTHKLIISQDVIFDEVLSIKSVSHSFQVNDDQEILIHPKIFQIQPIIQTHYGQLPNRQILPPPSQLQ